MSIESIGQVNDAVNEYKKYKELVNNINSLIAQAESQAQALWLNTAFRDNASADELAKVGLYHQE